MDFIDFTCTNCGKKNAYDPKTDTVFVGTDVMMEDDERLSSSPSPIPPRYFLKCKACGTRNVVTKKDKK